MVFHGFFLVFHRCSMAFIHPFLRLRGPLQAHGEQIPQDGHSPLAKSWGSGEVFFELDSLKNKTPIFG